MEKATLAGGCFWCIEAIYNELNGVESAISGYSGGHITNPSYEQVCTGRTGHAETVQITYDPEIISFKEILEVFFTIHDPTTLNRQGNDIGTHYRSVIFYHDSEQKALAENIIQEFEEKGIWNGIVTEVVPYEEFFPAEDYHQGYFKKNTNSNAYCKVVVEPKVVKFRKQFFDKLKNS